MFVLLDGRVERSKALARSAAELGLAGRVAVIAERAEVAAHRANLRFHFDAVVARSFGRPAVTAECGAGFLKEGGAFIVSEPPGTGEDRWPASGLAQLGLALESSVSTPLHFAVLRAVAPLDERYPRRVGIPTKRPLF